jgi:hypothetical protein
MVCSATADELSSVKAQADALSSEKAKLAPQLEQARWQGRQLEKKIEELVAAKAQVDTVRTA